MAVDINKIKLLADKLKSLNVGLVYLFGSEAEGTAGPLSDVDIGIVFTDPKIARGNITEIYNKLYNILTDYFDMRNFRNMDIVFLERASTELNFDVISHGVPLFEITQDFRTNFEERIAALYRDFMPILKANNEAVLAKI